MKRQITCFLIIIKRPFTFSFCNKHVLSTRKHGQPEVILVAVLRLWSWPQIPITEQIVIGLSMNLCGPCLHVPDKYTNIQSDRRRHTGKLTVTANRPCYSLLSWWLLPACRGFQSPCRRTERRWRPRVLDPAGCWGQRSAGQSSTADSLGRPPGTSPPLLPHHLHSA